MNASKGSMYLHYRLALRSPIIVSTLARDPNSAATQPFIPGSAIRGALAARLLSDRVKSDGEEFRTLVLSGALRYLHAYPEAGGARVLPTPASWRIAKDDPHSAYDLGAFTGAVAAEDSAKDFEEVWPEKALASATAPFTAASLSAGARRMILPRLNARLHQQRDRLKGRPWKDHDDQSHGAIFAYEYLEADQVFRGAIQVMGGEPTRIDRIKELFARPIVVGRSRRAGYGGEAAIDFIHDSLQEYENASDLLSSDVQAGDRFRAILTSAYVGRHPSTGQIDPAALEQELCSLLDGAAIVERRRHAFEVVGGFSQKWRLELPQALAVAAGSILVLKAERVISSVSLRQIEHEGLGERRIEGFGRMLFLEHHEDQKTLRLSDEVKREGAGVEGTKSAGATGIREGSQLRFLEARIVLNAARAELDRIATLDIAAKVDRKRIPATALLGRLRTVFRGVLDEETAKIALSRIATWCSDDDGDPKALKRAARSKLDRCKIFEDTLRQWLRKFAAPGDGQTLWKALLDASGTPDSLTGLATRHYLTEVPAAQDVLHTHAGELSVYLIDAVLAALARWNRGRAR